MKTLSCTDLGMGNCTFVARGENEKEVIDKMISHGKTAHPNDTNGVGNNEMVSMMRTKIKDAA